MLRSETIGMFASFKQYGQCPGWLCWTSLLGCWIWLTLNTLAAEPDALLESCTVCDCTPPDLWIVSSRCAPRLQNLDVGFEKLTFAHYDRQCNRFEPASLETFLACQSNIPTVLYAHGNALDAEAALESAWKIYERIQDCPGPKMMVLWSWPAERVLKRPRLRPIKLARDNIRTKYCYAEHQGYYIAKLTQLMSTAEPLTLTGHSFGGVAVICAMHYLGGGELNGLVFDAGLPQQRANLRGSIISGALDCDHLYPGHRYARALVAVERFHTTYNARDATLRRWPTLSLRGQQALGYTGIYPERFGPNAYKVLQQNMTSEVGRSHYLRPHLASDRLAAAICKTAFDSPLCSCEGRSTRPGRRIPTINPSNLIGVPAETVFPGLAL